MKSVWKYLRWGALVLGAMIVIAGVGIGLFTRTERFREFLRVQLVSTLNTSFQGRISLERIEGSIWGHLTLHNLAVHHHGSKILQVPRLTLSYALLPLLQNRVAVSRVEAVEPILRLIQDAEGNLNIVEAFSAQTPQEAPQESGLTILLDNVVLQGAHIDLTLSEDQEKPYHLTETNLDAQIGILSTGVDIEIRRLGTRLAAEGLPPLQTRAALAYQDAVLPATVRIGELALTTDHSRIWLTGEIHNLDTLDTAATLFIENLAAADVAHIVPASPLKEDVSGQVELTGPLTDLNGKLTLTAADAQVTANLQADLSQDTPKYTGTLKLARLDLQKLAELGDIGGIVDGTLQASGVGTALATLNAEAALQLQALRVGGWQLGTASFNGSFAQEQGKLRGGVKGGLGQATWQGQVSLAQVPRYEFALSVEHLDIKKVTAGQEPLAGDLNLKGSVRGQGFALSDMNTQAEIELLPSTIGPVEVQRGLLTAHLAGGQIQISEGTLIAQDTALTIQGEIGTTLEEVGQLSYSLQVDTLTPWLSLMGQQGSGSLSLTGEAKGNVANLHVQGTVQGNNLRLQGFSTQQAAFSFDLSEIGQAWPYGTLTAQLKALEAGVALRSVGAKITLPQGQPQSAQIALTAQDSAAHAHRLNAEVSYQPEQITARLSELSLELPDGTWQLTQPARILQSPGDITVERLLIAHADQQLLLDGSYSLSGSQNLLFQIDRLSLASLQALLPKTPELKGNLSARVQVNGTASAPDIIGNASLTDLQIAGQAYAGLSTSVTYTERQASLELAFQQDAAHTLSATGTLPLELSWAEGWQSRVLGDMDIRVHSSGLSLAFLNAVSGEAVQDVQGELNLDVRLRGPVSRPLPQGTFQLRDGQAAVTPLGVTLSAITLKGGMDPEQVQIEQILIKSRKGQIQGSGTIAMRDYLPEKLMISLTAERWPAIWTRQYKVEIGGQVSAEGPLTAPSVQGRLEVQRATLRPDLAFLDEKPIQRDDTIVIVSAEEATADETEKARLQASSQPDTFQNLALDLSVRLQRRTHIKHPNADVELTGEVQAVKERGQDLALAGGINVVHGWAGFQGRRFTLSRGQIVFSGGKDINPRLDIVAQYRLPEYLVEAIVGGTAAEPTLRLQSDPTLDQADILAVLLFGKPASALGRGEKVDLQQQALALTSGYAAATIGESVSQALGLEKLGIDLREVNFTGGSVGFGRYLTPNTRVSASQDLAGEKGREVSVEYQLAPGWSVNTSTSSTGASGADIIWRKQY